MRKPSEEALRAPISATSGRSSTDRSPTAQNIGGASERRITDAARAIEEAGSAGEFALDVTDRRHSLWKMGATGTIGLEIALNETVEKRMLDLEVRALEFMWKQEEEIAQIIDRELTPRHLLEAHLRRLPIKLRPRAMQMLAEAEGR